MKDLKQKVLSVLMGICFISALLAGEGIRRIRSIFRR